MDFEETMVEQDLGEQTDDTFEEIAEEEQDESESLESLMEGEEGAEAPAEEEPQEEPEPQATEPGWIKKRVEKAVNKAVAETEARMQAMFEQQMAPLREKMLNDEANELVKQGEFKSLERAKEYLRLKQGLPAAPAQEPEERPRERNGQFAPKNSDAGISARIEMLEHQADRISAGNGPDVIKAFMNDEEIKNAVVSGEMDFYDVAEVIRGRQAKRPPSPTRSPNGASGINPNAIANMTDEQFERMERRIKEGARFRLE